MKAPHIEVAQKDSGSLARSAVIRINGHKLLTPDLALDVPQSKAVSPEILSQSEFKGRTTLVEVHRILTIDRINECLGEGEDSDAARRNLENEIGSALRRTTDTGGVPVLILALTDNNRNPLNRLPDKQALSFVMDLLWRPENRVILPPLLGVLQEGSQYDSLIREFTLREQTIQERWVMAAIPSTYRPLTEEVIGKYWKAGARAFALDMQGRGFTGNSSAITLVQRALGKLRVDEKADFFLHAINSKERVGIQANARTNCLIGSAFGFDTVGLNHIPPKGFGGGGTPAEEVAKVVLLQASDYGYHSLRDLKAMNSAGEKVEIDTFPFDKESIETILKKANPDHARLVSKKHNLTKSLRETERMRGYLTKGKFGDFLMSKARVVEDYKLAKEVVQNVRRRTLDV